MERGPLRPSLGSRLGQGFSNALTSLALVPPRIFAASLTAVALFSTGLFMALLLIDAFELARAGIRTDAPIPTVVVVLISFVICVTVEFVGEGLSYGGSVIGGSGLGERWTGCKNTLSIRSRRMKLGVHLTKRVNNDEVLWIADMTNDPLENGIITGLH